MKMNKNCLAELLPLAVYIVKSYEPNDHEDNITDKAFDLLEHYADVTGDDAYYQAMYLVQDVIDIFQLDVGDLKTVKKLSQLKGIFMNRVRSIECKN